MNRYCYATVEGRRDDVVHFESGDLGLVADLGSDEPSALPLHDAAYRRICAQFSLGRPSLNLATVAEVPPGSGLGSSSTLVVSIIEAFRHYFDLPLGEYELARLAYEVERIDCGLDGGRQDQYAATFGGVNLMEFGPDESVLVSPLRLKAAIMREFEASLVLFHTGASRSSATIIAEQATYVRSGVDHRIEATHALRREATAMKEALLIGDFDRLAQVLRSGWKAKKGLADGISNTSIDRTMDLALASGALAGKVSGAGGGGYLMFLVEPVRRAGVIAALGSLDSGSVEAVSLVPDGAVAWTLR